MTGRAVVAAGIVIGNSNILIKQPTYFNTEMSFRLSHKSPKKSKHRSPEKKSRHGDRDRDRNDRKRDRSGSSHKSPKKKSRRH